MADKNNDEVEAKIDEIAQGLKDLLAQRDAENAEPKKTSAKSTAKKSTAKSTTAKPKSTAKPAAKKTAAKPAAKTTEKPAAKKPAAKKAAPKKEPVVEEEQAEPIDDEVAKAIAEAEAYAAAQNEPKAEEPSEPAKEPEHVEEKQEPVQAEATATQEAEEPKAEEPKAEEPAPEPEPEPEKAEAAAVQEPQATEKPAKKSGASFAAKTDAALKSKKAKLPIFITVNALFLISAILLMFASFYGKINGEEHTYNVFQFYANGDAIKAHLASQALGWGNGAYVMLGILMFFAMLVPLALMIKNIIIFVRKKDASVYNADALIYFATMLFFISMVNMFGAWLSAGQVISLIISALILAFTLLTMLITKSVKQLPFFSIINIVLVFMSLFMLTWKVYEADDQAWSPAAAGHVAGGGGFMFFMLLVTVIALVALVVLQMKRFPGAIGHIIEIVVPLVAAGCAFIAVIHAGAAKPDGASVSVGFVFGMIFTVLLAVADTLFTFLKPLKKYRVLVDDSNDGHGNNVFADETPVASDNASTEPAAEQAPAEEKPAEEKAEEEQTSVFCTECGTKNAPDCDFCTKCGTKLIK